MHTARLWSCWGALLCHGSNLSLPTGTNKRHLLSIATALSHESLIVSLILGFSECNVRARPLNVIVKVWDWSGTVLSCTRVMLCLSLYIPPTLALRCRPVQANIYLYLYSLYILEASSCQAYLSSNILLLLLHRIWYRCCYCNDAVKYFHSARDAGL